MMTDRVILAITVLIAAVYLYATTLIPSLEIGDPLGPKAFPRLLGIALLIAGGMLGLEILAAARNREAPKEAAGSAFNPHVVKVLACVAVWTGVYYATFEPLGFIVGTSIFLLPLMAWFNRGKWLANVLSAVLFSGFTYWLFVTLDVSLPKGLLPF